MSLKSNIGVEEDPLAMYCIHLFVEVIGCRRSGMVSPNGELV